MRVSKIICNKCGAEIETRPVSITIQIPVEKPKYKGSTIMQKTYKTVKTIHLCDECREQFEKEYDREGARNEYTRNYNGDYLLNNNRAFNNRQYEK